MFRLLRAYLLAAVGHRGQKDKSGRPYFNHIFRVARGAWRLTHRIEAAIVGLLHDYVEDVDPNGGSMIARHFGMDTAAHVLLLTRPPEVPFERYMVQILSSDDKLAQYVKVADLVDNTRADRVAAGMPADPAQREAYLQKDALRRTYLAELRSRLGL